MIHNVLVLYVQDIWQMMKWEGNRNRDRLSLKVPELREFKNMNLDYSKITTFNNTYYVVPECVPSATEPVQGIRLKESEIPSRSL